jgi:hypothetical protein
MSKLLRYLLNPYVHFSVVEEGAGGETPPGDDEAIGTGNDARLALLARIADESETVRGDEFEGTIDGDDDAPPKDPPQEQQAGTPPEDKTPPETPPEDQVTPQLIRIKVNGREMELPLEEVIARAQKVESADQYLADAKKQRQQQTPPADEPPAPSAEELARQAAQEDLVLVRALQTGSEEEALAAIRKIRSDAASPSVKSDDVGRMIDDRMQFQDALRAFNKEYPEISGDPVLTKMAQDMDTRLLSEGDDRPYAERYTEIGNNIRSWLGKYKPAETPPSGEQQPAQQMQTRVDRKAAAPSTPPTQSRRATPPATEPEGEEDSHSVIAQMAQKRGGPQWMR